MDFRLSGEPLQLPDKIQFVSSSVNFGTIQFLPGGQMIEKQRVTATNGATISIKAETVCIHGDGKHALEFAKTINQALIDNNIEMQSF